MKWLKLFALLLPFTASAQTEQPEVTRKTTGNWTLLARTSINPMVYRVTNDLESGRNVILDKVKNNEIRIQYTLKNVFAFRAGLGIQSENLIVSGPSIEELFSGDGHSHKAEVFAQHCEYVNVPLEIGFAPKIGKRGGFVPSAFLSVTPHFRAISRQSIVFNESIVTPTETQTQLASDFAGGMREVYTSLNAHAEFMFFVGSKKNFGFGPSFSINNNFNGPQTFLLSRGFGVGAGLNFGFRF